MATETASTSLVPVQPVFTDAERLALAGYLAGHRGLTREAYTFDLRQFTGWCRTRSASLFSWRRADIETFAANWKPADGPAPRSPGACAPSPLAQLVTRRRDRRGHRRPAGVRGIVLGRRAPVASSRLFLPMGPPFPCRSTPRTARGRASRARDLRWCSPCVPSRSYTGDRRSDHYPPAV
jgi:hypothetical protein